ncbi:MAG: cysteine-rich small domain-containing protein [Gemmiger sp.]
MGDQPHQYSYFSHRACEFFPCHPGADPSNFNCLFCYCPLYVLGDRCGGDFRYTPAGRKDCSACLFPHRRENYAAVLARYEELAALMPPRG